MRLCYQPHPFNPAPIRRYDGRGGTYPVCQDCYGGTEDATFGTNGPRVHPTAAPSTIIQSPFTRRALARELRGKVL